MDMENNEYTQQMQYKRTSRHPSDETRMKISQALRGRSKGETTKEKISSRLRDYWKNDSNFPDDV